MARTFEDRPVAVGSHPVDHFRSLLGQLGPDDYPAGVVSVPVTTPGTAFFSAGAGLVRRRGEPLPAFPFGGIMFVGHNLDAEIPYLKRVRTERDHGDPDRPSMPTWQKMYAMLRLAEVDTAEVFFTNYFVGLKAGANPNGPFPGRLDASFRVWCEAFLDEQIRVMQPSVIVALGSAVQQVLGWRYGEVRQASRAGVEFTAVGMLHTSFPRHYERVGELRRIDGEARLLRSALG